MTMNHEDNPLIERPSRPKPMAIRANDSASSSSLPANASSHSAEGGGGPPGSSGLAVPGKRAQMMRSMRNLNRAASDQPRQDVPRRCSTGDARTAFGGALAGQRRQRGTNNGNGDADGSNSMPNLFPEGSANDPTNSSNAGGGAQMFEEASRRRSERAATRRRSQEGPAGGGAIDTDLQPGQLAQSGIESRRASMRSQLSSTSGASDLPAGAGRRRRSVDCARRSMDLSSGAGRRGSMRQGSARSLNTSASGLSAESQASSALIGEQPVIEEEFNRLRLQMSSRQPPPASSTSAEAASASAMDGDERLARDLQEQYDRESRATHEGGHGLDMTELYDGTRLMVVNRNSMGNGSVGASTAGNDRRVICAGCSGRFRVSSGCELLMCPKCDTLTPV
jgi:hypothetical protein